IVASRKNALVLRPTQDSDLAETCGILDSMDLFYTTQPFNPDHLPQILRDFLGEPERAEVGGGRPDAAGACKGR
ncbi:MAG TPA: hypothetical protein VGG61_15465, partial [Gemmataceae bacterium]